MDISVLYTLGAALVGGGISWGGTLVSVSGIKDAQAEVKKDLAAHTAADTVIQLDLVSRLARIEGKLDEMRNQK